MRPLFILLSILWAPFMRAQTRAIQHVTVIDATGKPAQPDLTVVIEGGRIASVTPSAKAKIPKGAQIVDGMGKFLIPGLWDMHAHYLTDIIPFPREGIPFWWSYGLYLANGVVGVRDMWGPEDANAWRAKLAASGKPAPTMYSGSPIIDGPKPVDKDMISVGTEAQGREVVDRYNDHGSDFIKVYESLPRDVYFAIADEARKRGIPFAGHVPHSVTVQEGSDAGQKSMEHLFGVELACSNQEVEALRAERGRRGFVDSLLMYGRALKTYDDAKAQSLFACFVKNGTWQCPTLTVLRMNAFINDPQFTSDDRLKYIPKSARAEWAPTRYKDATPEDWAAIRAKFREDLKFVGRMHRAGVGIIAGTDVMNPYCFPGFSCTTSLPFLSRRAC